MKASIVAVGSLLGSAAASVHHRHVDFHAKRLSVLEPASNGTCGCSTGVTTIYGAMTLHPKPAPAPTPVVSSYSAPGTYTISETTVTLTETTTVASASTASLTPGQNTYGGVTTTVTAPTTVTVPCATEEGTSPATTSVVKTSTHHCSTAGTCIIGATTASVSVSTLTVYPVPATYPPGTYTVPATTVTVTDVNTVFVCPFSSVKATPSSTPATSEAPEAPKPTEAAPVKPTEAAPSKPAAPSVPAAPVNVPSVPKPKPKPGSYGGHGGSAPIKPHGNKWAMAYTPYTNSGACKTAAQVDADVSIIALKGFTSIRIYATDCSGLVNVGASCQKHGLKLIAGVFINEEGIGKAAGQVTEIINWGKQGNNWETIEMCVVGNEAVFNQFAGASELAGFISSTKQKLRSAGYNGPVTTTEPLGTLQAIKGTICSVIDVVAANIQPYFNSDIGSSDAGDFVASQLELTGEQCPGKEAYNLECGWPSQGSANGNAIAGALQQREAIEAILSSSAASRTAIFSFQNDAWKGEGEFGVEPWFGCAGIL